MSLLIELKIGDIIKEHVDAISTGAYRFPIDRASRIAKLTTRAFLSKNPEIEKVTFVCFSKEIYEAYL